MFDLGTATYDVSNRCNYVLREGATFADGSLGKQFDVDRIKPFIVGILTPRKV